MPRCQRKHLKRLAAPHHWLLSKSAGKFVSHPTTGPHKIRESLPIIIFLRDRLKYALNTKETVAIVKKRLVKVDGKVRTNPRYPAGIMDVVELMKSNELFRIIYDCKGRFVVHRIEAKEAAFKILRVNQYKIGNKGVPLVVTNDGRTINYVHPGVRVHDTLKFNIKTNEVESYIKFKIGNVAMVTGGGNTGRVGIITKIEKQMASFDIVHLKDASGAEFKTRIMNVFVIGENETPLITLPRRDGVRPSILEGVDTE